MKNKIKNLLIKNWPILFLLGTVLIVFRQNYLPHTFLIGWDNLMPEFNLPLNIQRSFVAVWQEYQGLGLLGGMGHASEFIHQIGLLILSFVMPMELLRYAWTFLMLFTGSTGAYFLLKKLILKDCELSEIKLQLISLLAGLFYLLNLSTMQTFSAPYEAFITHFAALPWLLLSSIIFFLKPTFKHGLILTIILFLAAPQAYLPTLFLVYIIGLLILITSLSFLKRDAFSLKSFTKMFLIIISANAFWLLPFLYFTLTSSQVALNAKINQLATATIFLQNKVFGNVFDVMLLKGFWFNNVNPDLHGSFTYMLSGWRDYLANPLIVALGLMFFLIIIIGLIHAFKAKKPIQIAFAILFIFSFTMLATDTPPFSWLDILFRKIPLFNEVFRFPFTKFSILTSLTYAIFFALGVNKISSYIGKFKNKLGYLFTALMILLLFVFSLPLFSGHLFYSKERLSVPKEYFQTFDFFKNQDPNTRIADLPLSNFWGWTYYNWGYGGSGFLWHGIQQPILDTAFDVWSKNDENYYWEMAQAIYSKNPNLFEQVLNKYQVTWLLVDKNVVEVSSTKAVFTPEIESMISQDSAITKAASFGGIDIYKVSLKTKPDKFVFLTQALPKINSSIWSNLDTAYSSILNYATDKTSNYDYYFPFRSLLSNKNQENLEYKMTQEANFIDISNPIPKSNNTNLIIPSYSNNEEIIPVSFMLSTNSDKSRTISLLINPLEIHILSTSSDTEVFSNRIALPLFNLPADFSIENATLDVNGISNLSGKEIEQKTTYLSLKQDNLIFLKSKNQTIEKTIASKDLTSLFDREVTVNLGQIKKDSQIMVKIPKISADQGFQITQPDSRMEKVQNCDSFNHGHYSSSVNNGLLMLSSQNASACTSILLPTPIHSLSYAILVNSKNLQGLPLNFWLLNEDEGYSLINTYLKTGSVLQASTFVIPPQENYGRTYSLHFDNISIGNDKTANALGNISFYPIPYNFISSLALSQNTNLKMSDPKATTTVETAHPNESLYLIKPGVTKNSTIVLSQSFDSGWKAYEANKINLLNKTFPFVFGKEIKQHILVNNWENGWEIEKTDENSTIMLIYLPQSLQCLGEILFILLIAIIIVGSIKYVKKNPD